MIKLLLFCLPVGFLVSCSGSDTVSPSGDGDMTHLRHFVNYYVAGEFQAAESGSEMRIDIEERVIYSSPAIIADQSDEAKEKFSSCAERNDDLSFDRVVSSLSYMNWVCFADNFKEVHVVCTNRDMDAEHPAGSPIDDLVNVRTQTCALFVHSGYPEDLLYEGSVWTSIDKPVSELQDGELAMISVQEGFRLSFIEKPEQMGACELEVMLVTTNNKTYIVRGSIESEDLAE